MSKKSDLKREIEQSELEIEELEKKRMRSHSALMEAQVSGVSPDPLDVEYFKTYSKLIAVERENLRRLNEKLNEL